MKKRNFENKNLRITNLNEVLKRVQKNIFFTLTSFSSLTTAFNAIYKTKPFLIYKTIQHLYL